MIWGLLPALGALRTTYGAFMLLKASSFCGAIGLAAINRMQILPALVAGAPNAVRRFRLDLVAECLVFGSVVAATATMTSLFSWQ